LGSLGVSRMSRRTLGRMLPTDSKSDVRGSSSGNVRIDERAIPLDTPMSSLQITRGRSVAPINQAFDGACGDSDGTANFAYPQPPRQNPLPYSGFVQAKLLAGLPDCN